MSQDTQEVQDNTTNAIAGAVPEVQDTEETITIGGESFTIVGTTHKKGKAKDKPVWYLKVPEGDLTPFISKVAKAVGESNFYKEVLKLIRQACSDATAQAINEAEDGVPSDTGFEKAFISFFVADTRRGPHIKDLREKAMSIFSDLQPLLARHFEPEKNIDGSANPKFEPLSQEEHNRMLQLTLEYSDVQKAIEGKSTKGKKAPAKKK